MCELSHVWAAVNRPKLVALRQDRDLNWPPSYVVLQTSRCGQHGRSALTRELEVLLGSDGSPWRGDEPIRTLHKNVAVFVLSIAVL